MATRRFTFEKGKSRKFWTISQTGKKYTVKFGRIDTSGRTQTKEFASQIAARAAMEKLIAEKLRKGYLESRGVATDTSSTKKTLSVKLTAKKKPVVAAKETDRLITVFKRDQRKLDVIRQCMEHYGVGDADAEWPHNIISRQAVVYASGMIARKGTPVRHAVDSRELYLCRQLAAEIAGIMDGTNVGMGSEARDSFGEFFIAANANEPRARRITSQLIRSKFGGTIFPPAAITVEPLKEGGKWWSAVKHAGSLSEPEYFNPWRAMIQWFRKCTALIDSSFVQIGSMPELWTVPEEKYPEGTEMTGCVLPRLALGLTKKGSLVGLFGVVVQT